MRLAKTHHLRDELSSRGVVSSSARAAVSGGGGGAGGGSHPANDNSSRPQRAGHRGSFTVGGWGGSPGWTQPQPSPAPSSPRTRKKNVRVTVADHPSAEWANTDGRGDPTVAEENPHRPLLGNGSNGYSGRGAPLLPESNSLVTKSMGDGPSSSASLALTTTSRPSPAGADLGDNPAGPPLFITATNLQRGGAVAALGITDTQDLKVSLWPSGATPGGGPSGGKLLQPLSGRRAMTSKAPLALQLEAFIRKEHRQFLLDHPGCAKSETLPIFREAFRVLTEHFSEYRSVLTLIQDEYEAALTDVLEQVKRMRIIDLENKSDRSLHAMELAAVKESLNTTISNQRAELLSAQGLIHALREQLAAAENTNEFLRREIRKNNKEHVHALEQVKLLSTTITEEASRSAGMLQALKKKDKDVELLNSCVKVLREEVEELHTSLLEQLRIAMEQRAPGTNPTMMPPRKNSKASKALAKVKAANNRSKRDRRKSSSSTVGSRLGDEDDEEDEEDDGDSNGGGGGGGGGGATHSYPEEYVRSLLSKLDDLAVQVEKWKRKATDAAAQAAAARQAASTATIVDPNAFSTSSGPFSVTHPIRRKTTGAVATIHAEGVGEGSSPILDHGSPLFPSGNSPPRPRDRKKLGAGRGGEDLPGDTGGGAGGGEVLVLGPGRRRATIDTSGGSGNPLYDGAGGVEEGSGGRSGDGSPAAAATDGSSPMMQSAMSNSVSSTSTAAFPFQQLRRNSTLAGGAGNGGMGESINGPPSMPTSSSIPELEATNHTNMFGHSSTGAPGGGGGFFSSSGFTVYSPNRFQSRYGQMQSSRSSLLQQRQAELQQVQVEYPIIQAWLREEGIGEKELEATDTLLSSGQWHGMDMSFLGVAEPVKNLHLDLEAVLQLLDRIWGERESKLTYSRLRNFFLQWLEKETGNTAAGKVLGVNMMWICLRNIHDPDCYVFIHALKGFIPEDVALTWRKGIRHLRRTCENNTNYTLEKEQLIHVSILFEALRGFFPEKSIEHMLQLRFCFYRASGGSENASWPELMKEHSTFVQYIKRQMIREIEEFTLLVVERLRAAVEPTKPDHIQVKKVSQVLQACDPALPDYVVRKMTAEACLKTIRDVAIADDTLLVALNTVLSRFRSVVLLRRASIPNAESWKAGVLNEGQQDEAESPSAKRKRLMEQSPSY